MFYIYYILYIDGWAMADGARWVLPHETSGKFVACVELVIPRANCRCTCSSLSVLDT